MAVITTEVELTGIRFPYEFDKARARIDYSDYPRGELRFFDSESVPAKIATNESVYIGNINLPQGFIYQLASIGMFVQEVTGGGIDIAPLQDFSQLATVSAQFMSNNGGGHMGALKGSAIDGGTSFAVDDSGANAINVYTAQNIYQGLLWPDPTFGQPRIRVVLGDFSADATANVFVRLAAKVIIYDVAQGHRVFVNTPSQLVNNS